MVKHIVIADDLTGANAVSILLKKRGIKAVTWLGKEEEVPCTEACVFTTDSRGLGKSEAYEKVLNLTVELKQRGAESFSKRIDSTMRGNIGAELDGILDGLGDGTVAICTPAYPDAGRVVVNGELMINGLPLTQTELADDPKSRIFTSNIKRIICEQSKYKVCNIFLHDIQGSETQISDKLDAALEAGYRIIVCDIEKNDDIVKLSKALRLNKHSFLTADPGRLTAEMVKRGSMLQMQLFANKVLAIIGSVNVKTRRQLEELWKTEKGVEKVIVDTAKLIQRDQRHMEIRRVLDEVKYLKDRCNVITIVGDGIYPEKRLEMTEALSNVINGAFADITYEILKEWKCFQGLYSSGGDITRAVYKRCGVKGVHVLDEVLPLAVYGELIGSDFSGMKIITKGGSQGELQAIRQCVMYLLRSIE